MTWYALAFMAFSLGFFEPRLTEAAPLIEKNLTWGFPNGKFAKLEYILRRRDFYISDRLYAKAVFVEMPMTEHVAECSLAPSDYKIFSISNFDYIVDREECCSSAHILLPRDVLRPRLYFNVFRNPKVKTLDIIGRECMSSVSNNQIDRIGSSGIEKTWRNIPTHYLPAFIGDGLVEKRFDAYISCGDTFGDFSRDAGSLCLNLSCFGGYLCSYRLVFGGDSEVVSVGRTRIDRGPLKERDNQKAESEDRQVSGKSRRWIALPKPPPWLFRAIGALFSSLGLLGFVLLFGPQNRPSLARQNVGFALVVLSSTILIGAPLLWAISD